MFLKFHKSCCVLSRANGESNQILSEFKNSVLPSSTQSRNMSTKNSYKNLVRDVSLPVISPLIGVSFPSSIVHRAENEHYDANFVGFIFFINIFYFIHSPKAVVIIVTLYST